MEFLYIAEPIWCGKCLSWPRTPDEDEFRNEKSDITRLKVADIWRNRIPNGITTSINRIRMVIEHSGTITPPAAARP